MITGDDGNGWIVTDERYVVMPWLPDMVKT